MAFFAVLGRYFDSRKALLATLFLSFIPEFLAVGSFQYADILLAFYNLAGDLCCFIALKEERRDFYGIGSDVFRL